MKCGESPLHSPRTSFLGESASWGSAYAQFEEGKKGQLNQVECADFIVLSNDLTKVPAAQFTKTRVLRTVVGGRSVIRLTESRWSSFRRNCPWACTLAQNLRR